jgi:hypothetical protein
MYLQYLDLWYQLTISLRLKKQYRAVNERIGRTGAGLNAEDVTPGSEIANIIGTLNLCVLRCSYCI